MGLDADDVGKASELIPGKRSRGAGRLGGKNPPWRPWRCGWLCKLAAAAAAAAAACRCGGSMGIPSGGKKSEPNPPPSFNPYGFKSNPLLPD